MTLKTSDIVKTGGTTYVSTRRLYLDATKKKVVEEKDGHFLLVAEGGELTESEAKRYGLLEEQPAAPVQSAPSPETIEQRETRVPKNLTKR